MEYRMCLFVTLAALVITHVSCTVTKCFEPNPQKAKYNYDPKTCLSPSHWNQISPSWGNCTTFWNLRQSPININTLDTVYMPIHKLGFHNLCKRVKGKATNNGHHPEFETTNKNIKLFNVPGQGHDKFIFKEIHVHTGVLESAGSEHSIDNNFTPIEIHAVFYNEHFKDAMEAQSKTNGMTVIAVQVQVAADETENVDSVSLEPRDMESINQACPCAPLDLNCRKEKCFCKGSKDLICKATKNHMCSDKFGEGLVCRASGIARCTGDQQCSGLKKCRRNDFVQANQTPNNFCSLPKVCRVRYAHELSHLMEKYYQKIHEYKPKTAPDAKRFTRILENITPRDILPYSWNYYTYSGSLTAPPCYETVQWIVMRCPIKISRKAYLMLQLMEDITHIPLMAHGTRRPIQRGKSGLHRVEVSRNFLWNEAQDETSFCDVNQ
ncbi:nacrein-like protein [Saccostrea cucullata]|uniref:nacrein-like protein n=1 Tax=Saccostrea cuccullata TaxID=36930 RepID=UPI002ED4E336